MKPDVSISIDPAANLVHLTLAGFFMPADVAALRQTMSVEYRQLRCRLGAHRTLLDVRGMAIQAQETVPAFAEIIYDQVFKSTRLAVVIANTLVRMQIGRVAASREDTRFFTDAQEAWSWLRRD